MMKRMIDSKAQTVEAELIEDFGVEMERASSIRLCLSNFWGFFYKDHEDAQAFFAGDLIESIKERARNNIPFLH